MTFNAKMRLPNATSNPSSPSKGHTYFNTTVNKPQLYNGTEWKTVKLEDPFSATGGTEYTSGGYKYHKLQHQAFYQLMVIKIM